ncbi:MAG: hypothetical protein HOO06_15015 [Bdellovibrionaceae bacterium]|jgi:hypothetical protein|nr:hypothetical protein [Pseudobdellovibrionaceae bacterium]
MKKKLVTKISDGHQRFALRVFLFMSFLFEDFKDRVKEGLEKLRDYLAYEKEETREMLAIYLKFNQGEATKEELSKAHKQFRDVLKNLGLGFMLVLPFSPVTLPLLVKVGVKLGIQVLPDFFYREDES